MDHPERWFGVKYSCLLEHFDRDLCEATANKFNTINDTPEKSGCAYRQSCCRGVCVSIEKLLHLFFCRIRLHATLNYHLRKQLLTVHTRQQNAQVVITTATLLTILSVHVAMIDGAYVS